MCECVDCAFKVELSRDLMTLKNAKCVFTSIKCAMHILNQYVCSFLLMTKRMHIECDVAISATHSCVRTATKSMWCDGNAINLNEHYYYFNLYFSNNLKRKICSSQMITLENKILIQMQLNSIDFVSVSDSFIIHWWIYSRVHSRLRCNKLMTSGAVAFSRTMKRTISSEIEINRSA